MTNVLKCFQCLTNSSNALHKSIERHNLNIKAFAFLFTILHCDRKKIKYNEFGLNFKLDLFQKQKFHLKVQ